MTFEVHLPACIFGFCAVACFDMFSVFIQLTSCALSLCKDAVLKFDGQVQLLALTLARSLASYRRSQATPFRLCSCFPSLSRRTSDYTCRRQPRSSVHTRMDPVQVWRASRRRCRSHSALQAAELIIGIDPSARPRVRFPDRLAQATLWFAVFPPELRLVLAEVPCYTCLQCLPTLAAPTLCSFLYFVVCSSLPDRSSSPHH